MSSAPHAVGRVSLVRRLFGPGSVGRYGVIGVSGVSIDTALFALLVHLGLSPVPATVVSTLAGIGNNYVLNAHFNFGTGFDLVQGSRFLLVGLVGLLVAAGSLHVLVSWLGMSPVPAKLVTLPVVVVSQFLANKHWSFRS